MPSTPLKQMFDKRTETSDGEICSVKEVSVVFAFYNCFCKGWCDRNQRSVVSLSLTLSISPSPTERRNVKSLRFHQLGKDKSVIFWSSFQLQYQDRCHPSLDSFGEFQSWAIRRAEELSGFFTRERWWWTLRWYLWLGLSSLLQQNRTEMIEDCSQLLIPLWF